ncbi:MULTISPECIES: cation:proton antiporter [Rhodococcus]|uniref:Cation:proton antiporter n=1 Tax=Rhodococcus oxybenzonivorans TaxID=1990687 RepID=A0AAE5A986_9NOCA|nr:MULTISPECIES: cation:proton antiporter [Rhodococcus]MDV7245242.1 cation:proton antiporter [Rhodococcus oxybenzonivorans]MDV7267938.1 cation:proton antiporter [Rhodococcus oxybenzonivorans]MDV7272478.1 cation:proton antiporter [Rhodococcus oxybenzonivorans]MDV7336267.1 cation:proton antiporter [Rhodococcus oxybenzonivorans]MDV7342952.1 cation:proton antiporter [Rhodococcus oxybenzonivorans]
MTWALPAIAAILLAYAAISGRTTGTPITAPIVFTVGGLLLGASTVGLIDVHPAAETVKLLAEVTLALVLFSDASRVDLSALRAEIALPARLLGIGLPLTIAAGFGAALFLLGDLAWPETLLLAVILAPTDAALGQAVVTLPILPSRIRQGLNVESGLNDGICVPLFLIVLAIAQAEAGAIGGGAAARLVAEQIGYGIVAGIGAGAIAAAILVIAGRHRTIDPLWAQTVPLTAALLAYTVAVPLGGSGFIAAFVGGLTFGAIRHRTEVNHGDGESSDGADLLDEAGDLFNAITFIVFGAVLLGPALGNLSWAVLGYAVVSLTVVRMVPVALSLVGAHPRAPTVAFLGWFGPRGLATIVFVILIFEESGELPHEELLLTTAVITIGLSVLAHGLTAAPLADRYASWFRRHPRGEGVMAPDPGR